MTCKQTLLFFKYIFSQYNTWCNSIICHVEYIIRWTVSLVLGITLAAIQGFPYKLTLINLSSNLAWFHVGLNAKETKWSFGKLICSSSPLLIWNVWSGSLVWVRVIAYELFRSVAYRVAAPPPPLIIAMQFLCSYRKIFFGILKNTYHLLSSNVKVAVSPNLSTFC